MKPFKPNHNRALLSGLAFAQVGIIKLFDLGFLPQLLSFEPGGRECHVLADVCHSQTLSLQCCVKGCRGLEL